MSQLAKDFYLKDNVVWMDEKFVIPMNLTTAINNRIHAFHHGKDTWHPYIYRSIASIADDCVKCTATGKNLKPLLSKSEIGKITEPKEPNDFGDLLII